MVGRREVGVAVDDHASLELPHHPLRAKLLLAKRQPNLDAEPTEDSSPADSAAVAFVTSPVSLEYSRLSIS